MKQRILKILLLIETKTLNENTGFSEDTENAVTLDDKRVIQDQYFNIELEEWGNVRFVSYLPSEEVYMEDVSFFLTKENQMIYSLCKQFIQWLYVVLLGGFGQ
uniref:hypothetical protein n=1 Tax=Agathobacter sp. TaxID=2021311 RepID=UPI004055D596